MQRLDRARSSASEVCDKLHSTAQGHEKEFGRDALWHFFQIHTCICHRVADKTSASVQLLKLNKLFTLKCLQMYRNYREGKFAPFQIPKLWVVALAAYEEKRSSLFEVLPKMAAAHILEDLEACLFAVDVSEDEYNEVFSDIIYCLDEMSPDTMSSPKLSELLLQAMHRVLRPARNLIIFEMRSVAYLFAKKRKNLKKAAPRTKQRIRKI